MGRLGVFAWVFVALIAGSVCADPLLTAGDFVLLDTDGDGVNDWTDNAIGFANAAQTDLDGDGVGSVIDPNDLNVAITGNRDVVANIGGAYTIAAGETLVVNVTPVDTPVGGYGVLRLHLGGERGYYVGAMSAGTTFSVDVPADFITGNSAFDLNTPGIYDFTGFITSDSPVRLHASGATKRFERKIATKKGGVSITTVTVTAPVPEPGTIVLFGAGAIALTVWRRRKYAKSG